MQNHIDINSAFYQRDKVLVILAQARVEKNRVYRSLIIADENDHPDKQEWKLRHQALHDIIRGLEYLATQILVTGNPTEKSLTR